eukprot:gene22928-29106_t
MFAATYPPPTNCVTPPVIKSKDKVVQPTILPPVPTQSSLKSTIVITACNTIKPPVTEPSTVSSDLLVLASLMFGDKSAPTSSEPNSHDVLDDVYKSYCRVTASQSPSSSPATATSSEETVVPFWQQQNQQNYLQQQQLSYQYKYDYYDNSRIRIEYAPLARGVDQQTKRIEIHTDFPPPVIQPLSALLHTARRGCSY